MWIIVTKNPKAEEIGRTFLKPGIPATIGRAPDCTIFLTVPSISRRQGRLEIRNLSPVYFDDETSTGARVNGHYVRGPTTLDEKSVLEIGGFQFNLERDPLAKPLRQVPAAAAPAPAAAPIDWSAAAADGSGESGLKLGQMLAQRIQGIRQHRDQFSEAAKSQKVNLNAEWTALVASARGLQSRLGGDSRIQSFAVSRDEGEILVKLAAPGTALGFHSLIVARHHPDGKYPDLDGAWVMELGRPAAHFPSPREAMEEFIQRLAPRLA